MAETETPPPPSPITASFREHSSVKDELILIPISEPQPSSQHVSPLSDPPSETPSHPSDDDLPSTSGIVLTSTSNSPKRTRPTLLAIVVPPSVKNLRSLVTEDDDKKEAGETDEEKEEEEEEDVAEVEREAVGEDEDHFEAGVQDTQTSPISSASLLDDASAGATESDQSQVHRLMASPDVVGRRAEHPLDSYQCESPLAEKDGSGMGSYETSEFRSKDHANIPGYI